MSSAKPPSLEQERILSRYRVYRNEEVVLGPGKAALLALIEETGSVSEAARRMGMSYNRAWLHIKVMNQNFSEPLVTLVRGGSAGGGAQLTPLGKKVAVLWQRLEKEAAKATEGVRADLLKLLAKA